MRWQVVVALGRADGRRHLHLGGAKNKECVSVSLSTTSWKESVCWRSDVFSLRQPISVGWLQRARPIGTAVGANVE